MTNKFTSDAVARILQIPTKTLTNWKTRALFDPFAFNVEMRRRGPARQNSIADLHRLCILKSLIDSYDVSVRRAGVICRAVKDEMLINPGFLLIRKARPGFSSLRWCRDANEVSRALEACDEYCPIVINTFLIQEFIQARIRKLEIVPARPIDENESELDGPLGLGITNESVK
jgi:hypothetical protein